MPLTLILMRHAKSSWDNPAMDDFDRPLNGRGRVAAAEVGDWLVAHGYLPDTVLVSGARRTVETWERMAAKMPRTATMESSPALYLAGAKVMLDVLRTRKSPVIMLIAHNPGIAEFASRIVETPPDHPDFGRYPTGATTIVEFDAASWAGIDWARGRVLGFIVPRDLAD